ncbi:MAG: hypothetical protein K0Q93_1023 [Nocardioidaceae bacterium]|jgi:hypothetical protein|nr:hypothetical protein [Nocardioidaceae bacterium]
MTLMTRLVACLAGVLLMLATLTACGGDEAGSASDSGSDSSSESADEPTEDSGGDSGGEQTDGPADGPTDGSADGADGPYCEALKDARDRLQALEGQGGDTASFEQAIGALRSVSDEAPANVAGDWRVLLDGFDTFVQALDEAGVSLEDLSDPQAMSDIKPQELQQLQQKLGSLDSKRFQRAGSSISEHARSECGFDLEGSEVQ